MIDLFYQGCALTYSEAHEHGSGYFEPMQCSFRSPILILAAICLCHHPSPFSIEICHEHNPTYCVIIASINYSTALFLSFSFFFFLFYFFFLLIPPLVIFRLTTTSPRGMELAPCTYSYISRYTITI